MFTRYLLPNKMKKLGWIIAIPSFILMIVVLHFDFNFSFLDYSRHADKLSFDKSFLFNLQSNNFTDEIGSVLLITGLLLIAFSREKDEDERIARLRLDSLLWAVLVNSLLMIFCIVFFYNELFLNVMAYNICTTLILFIARFNVVIFNERKKISLEI